MQTILNLKLKTENQSKMEFGAAQMKLNEELDRMEGLKARRLDYLEKGRALQEDGPLDIPEIRFNRDAVSKMDDLIKIQAGVIEKAEKKVEKARIKLTHDMQERKMQESLRDKAFEDFVQEEKDAENKENDQRTSFTYGQRINRSREKG